MLHHVSFNARDPMVVASTLAGMLGGAAVVRAPSPPFPSDSWFVCFGDAEGSMIEVLPWGRVLDPEAPFGVSHDAEMRPRSGAHVLCATPLPVAEVKALAAAAGWRSETVDTSLFTIVKVWVENSVLVEFLPPELQPAYRRSFDAQGLATLDARLRALETHLAARAAIAKD
jgi:hypothetical protein